MGGNNISIVASEPSPRVVFDFDANRFSLSGTCYPENSRAFFDPLLSALETHLKSQRDVGVAFELRLTYFNSGSSRAFIRFFDLLETYALRGNPVQIDWYCEPDDENMIELASEFEEDFNAARFRVITGG